MHHVNVAPIGTCRIHTPLRRAASVLPFQLSLTRNYGFVHTSAEVLQRLDLITGGTPVPQALWPLIYRPNTTAELLARPPRPVDKFFFEISSAKHVTLEAVPVQFNYVTRYFGEFFGSTALARRFWASARDQDCTDRLAWLRTVSQFGRLSKQDQEILAALRVREQTSDEIAADMAAIVERVGTENAVFITHVNALTPDNAPIASRRGLIEVVEQLAASLNVPCFDPSAHMNAFGQANAMERQGLDLTHFTLPFADHLGRTWFEKYIRNVANSADETYMERMKREHDEISSLQAQFETGRIVEVSHILHAAIRSGEATDGHRRLLAQIAFALGDFERTTTVLQALCNANGAYEDDDVLLMNAYLRQGDNLGAINLGRSMLADEREGDDIFEACAVAAQKLGLLHEALVYRRRLVGAGAPGQHAAALLSLLLQMQEFDEADKLADVTLAAKPNDLSCLRAKWKVALVRRDTAVLAGLAGPLSALDDELALELVQAAWGAGLAKPAAVLLGACRRQSPPSKAATELASQLGELWRTEGMSSFEAGDLKRAADLLGACIELAPDTGMSTRTALALERRLRAEVRQAFAAKDHPRVMMLADIALSNGISFNGFERLVGRSAAELGQCEVALPYLRKVVELDPSPASRLQFARTAAKARRYDQALAAFNAVLKDGTATPAQRSAALRAIGVMYSGTVNSARQAIAAGDVDQAWQLLKLLSVHSDKGEKISREQGRIIRQLRLELNSYDASEHAMRLEMANTVLSLDPKDVGARRIAAVAAMRTLNFNEARAHWRTLAHLAELTPQIEFAIAKCELWIARDQKRKAA
jgi:tetratricopeptide (TPR) repeat protein